MTYRPSTSDDTEAILDIMVVCFGVDRARAARWMEMIGDDDRRVLDEGGVAATLGVIPMGQYFGGVSIPLAGVGSVGVPPDRRGTGVATRLMAEFVRECRERDVPLAGLYASKQRLYRRSGFEQAAHRTRIALPLHHIDARETPLHVRRADVDDHDAIHAVYGRVARVSPGHLDRGTFMWTRTHMPKGELAHHWVFERGNTIEGYVIYQIEQRPGSIRYDLHVSDLQFETGDAARSILAFLAGHANLSEEVVFFGGPDHPLLHLLGEQKFDVTTKDYAMLRVVDPVRALEMRHWPDVETSLTIRILDETLGDRTFRLETSGGRMQVTDATTSGSSPHMTMNVRTFATIYAGFRSATTCARLGLVEGQRLDVADLLFRSVPPSCPDMY